MTEYQRRAILAAHYTEPSLGRINAKAHVLSESGITSRADWDILMDNGIIGKSRYNNQKTIVDYFNSNKKKFDITGKDVRDMDASKLAKNIAANKGELEPKIRNLILQELNVPKTRWSSISDGEFDYLVSTVGGDLKEIILPPKHIFRTKAELRSAQFDDTVYVRFEDELKTSWPADGEVGNLPYKKKMMRPARGPRYSTVKQSTLIRDGYLLSDGRLNPKWSSQKRKNYIRDNHGVDVGFNQRNMIFYKIEKGADIEPFGKYDNIVVGDVVPAVKVIRRK